MEIIPFTIIASVFLRITEQDRGSYLMSATEERLVNIFLF